MSRTYRKILRLGICTGSNTEYYRTKRRKFRRKAKEQLRINLEDFINPEDLNQFKDSWDEPTDGSWKYPWESLQDKEIQCKLNKKYTVNLDWYMSLRRKLKHYQYNKWNYDKRN